MKSKNLFVTDVGVCHDVINCARCGVSEVKSACYNKQEKHKNQFVLV